MHGEFTPIESGIGGLLVGISAASVLIVHGRVAGISGILSGLRTARGADFVWRALFLAGLVLGAFLNGALNPRAELPTLPARSVARYVTAGVLVGAGTKLGNGCTSGHGVCGLARGSRRSLAAVLTFMAVGAAATTAINIAQPPLGGPPAAWSVAPLRVHDAAHHAPAIALAVVAGLLALTAQAGHSQLNAVLSGVTFGMGLAISGMSYADKVSGFLDVGCFAGPWDPSLACVMGGGLIGSTLGYQYSLRLPSPVLAPKFALPTRRDVDFRLVFGSALFGAGWALGGMCPGPALANLMLPAFGVDITHTGMPFVAAMAAAAAATEMALPAEGAASSKAKKH